MKASLKSPSGAAKNSSKTIAASVYEIIRDEIVTLKRPPGSPISDKKISADLGISRTPMREAFLRLMEEGFIVAIPYSGTFVTKIQVNALKDAQFIRKSLECSAIEEAAKAANDNDILELERILEEQKIAAGVNRTEFIKIDNEFHKKIFDISGHLKVWDIVLTAKCQINRARYLIITEETRLSKIIDEHQKIIDALKVNDVAKATQDLANHIDISYSFIEKTLNSFQMYIDD